MKSKVSATMRRARWRPIRDEEKIDAMLQMIIDLHVKLNRLKDI